MRWWGGMELREYEAEQEGVVEDVDAEAANVKFSMPHLPNDVFQSILQIF